MVTQIVARIGAAAAAVGVFLTWTNDGPVHFDGTQGPNNGWLIVIVAAFAVGWTRSMARGSWIGVIGVLGSAVVIGWTAIENWRDNHDVLGATAGAGVVLVVAASVVLAVAAALRGVELARAHRAGS